jgi:hypothetical protein
MVEHPPLPSGRAGAGNGRRPGHRLRGRPGPVRKGIRPRGDSAAPRPALASPGRAYAAFRNEAPTLQQVESQLWRYPLHVAAASGEQEGVARHVLSVRDIADELGMASNAEIVDVEGKDQRFLQREILGRRSAYVPCCVASGFRGWWIAPSWRSGWRTRCSPGDDACPAMRQFNERVLGPWTPAKAGLGQTPVLAAGCFQAIRPEVSSRRSSRHWANPSPGCPHMRGWRTGRGSHRVQGAMAKFQENGKLRRSFRTRSIQRPVFSLGAALRYDNGSK